MPENRTPKLRGLAALLVAGLLLAAAGGAQDEAPPPQEPDQTVVKATAYVDPMSLIPVLGMLPVRARYHDDAGALVLRGQPDEVAAALKLIEALDQPPKPRPRIGLTVHVLAASKKAGSDEVPAALAPVARQLRQIFSFGVVELLDTVYLQTSRDADGGISGGLPFDDDGGGVAMGYALQFDKASLVQEGEEQVVRLQNFHFRYGPMSEGVDLVGLRTDVEIKQGQKAVIGKATPAGTERTLILVLEADVDAGADGGQ